MKLNVAKTGEFLWATSFKIDSFSLDCQLIR